MAYLINPLFSVRRVVMLTLTLAACDSFTKAMGLCQFEDLLQNSTHPTEEQKSGDEEMWIQWIQRLYLPLNETRMTWNEAGLECKRHHQDAHLVHIDSYEENEFIFSLRSLFDDLTWIGLSDESTEGLWKWDNNSTAEYLKWGKEEPNGITNENCAGVFLPSLPSSWFDINCASLLYVICERPLSKT